MVTILKQKKTFLYGGSLSGFSLAELLIALGVLAVIATYTIPKIIYIQAEQKKKAVFKDVLSGIAAITYQAALEGGNFTPAAERAYFRVRLNYIKNCQTNPTTEGCWSTEGNGSPGNSEAYILANGAFLTSINGAASNYDTIAIDYNGLELPNLAGKDILGVVACFGPTDCSSIISAGHPIRPGAIGPTGGASQTLYEWIFSDD